jgi:hypothetical protein
VQGMYRNHSLNIWSLSDEKNCRHRRKHEHLDTHTKPICTRKYSHIWCFQILNT